MVYISDANSEANIKRIEAVQLVIFTELVGDRCDAVFYIFFFS